MYPKNRDCFNVQQVLQGLLKSADKKPSMPAKLRVRRVLRQIAERRQDIMEEVALLHDRFAVKDPDGKIVYEDKGKTAIKVQEGKKEELDELYEELLDSEWEDAPTLSANMMEKEFSPSFEVVWLLGDFLDEDVEESEEDEARRKAETKRERKRTKRLAEVAEQNGSDVEAVEA